MADCYLVNVKNSVFRNLRFHLRSDGDKEKFLNDVIGYCSKLLADPSEPKVRRQRRVPERRDRDVRNGRRFVTRR